MSDFNAFQIMLEVKADIERNDSLMVATLSSSFIGDNTLRSCVFFNNCRYFRKQSILLTHEMEYINNNIIVTQSGVMYCIGLHEST